MLKKISTGSITVKSSLQKRFSNLDNKHPLNEIKSMNIAIFANMVYCTHVLLPKKNNKCCYIWKYQMNNS